MQRLWYSSLPFKFCLLVSIILLGLGALIAIAPEVGGRVFGLDGYEGGFQLVAGMRTSYLGFIVLLLTIAKERRALGILLTSLALNPLGDFLTVLVVPTGNFWNAAVHLPGFLVTLLLGGYLLEDIFVESVYVDAAVSSGLCRTTPGCYTLTCALLVHTLNLCRFQSVFSEFSAQIIASTSCNELCGCTIMRLMRATPVYGASVYL